MNSKKSGSSRCLLRSKTCCLLPCVQSRRACDSQLELLRWFGAVKLGPAKNYADSGAAAKKNKGSTQYRFENNGAPHLLQSLVQVLKFHAPDVSFNRVCFEWEAKSGCSAMRNGDPSKSRPTLIVCSSAGTKPGKIEGGTLEI